MPRRASTLRAAAWLGPPTSNYIPPSMRRTNHIGNKKLTSIVQPTRCHGKLSGLCLVGVDSLMASDQQKVPNVTLLGSHQGKLIGALQSHD